MNPFEDEMVDGQDYMYNFASNNDDSDFSRLTEQLEQSSGFRNVTISNNDQVPDKNSDNTKFKRNTIGKQQFSTQLNNY